MNPFQAQYPLSARKFWKKFIPNIIPAILVSALLGALLGAFIPVILNSETTTNGMIVSMVGLFVLLLVLILGINAWYIKAYIKSYFYEGGDNFITIKKGVFAPKEIHVQYQKIQDVYVDQDILDRIMGLYDVHIASATMASGMEAHIDGVDATVAQGLKEFFLHKIQNPGATSASMQGVNGEAVAAATPAPAAAVFSEEISDKTYPIQGAWLVSSIIGSIVSSVIFAGFISFYAWAKEDKTADGSLPIFSIPFFLGVSVVIWVIQVIGLFLWKANYKFQFLPEYVQYSTGILSKSEQHLPYRSIQDVNINQSFLERLFGISSVIIENAAQVQVGKRSMNAKIKIVGLTPAQATHIVETLKPIILARNSAQMGL